MEISRTTREITRLIYSIKTKIWTTFRQDFRISTSIRKSWRRMWWWKSQVRRYQGWGKFDSQNYNFWITLENSIKIGIRMWSPLLGLKEGNGVQIKFSTDLNLRRSCWLRPRMKPRIFLMGTKRPKQRIGDREIFRRCQATTTRSSRRGALSSPYRARWTIIHTEGYLNSQVDEPKMKARWACEHTARPRFKARERTYLSWSQSLTRSNREVWVRTPLKSLDWQWRTKTILEQTCTR